jgi:SAM-dependent methyltransferase
MHDNMSDSTFDENTYLERNPDVKRAVGSGEFKSGFDHFMKFGRLENRGGVRVDPMAHENAERYPREHLRFRVHGGRDLAGYLYMGETIARDLNGLVEDKLVQVPEDANVLDFGCGPGRVVTWFQPRHASWKFHGTDIDPEAIGWARENLSSIAAFDCNAAAPPLRYADGHFDFIYSISIFTHLPEDMQSAWLAELARVTRPGGYLALTTHGEHLLPKQQQKPSDGFYYSVGDRTQGLPEFYQTSFQTSAYIEREWSKYLNIEKILERGLAEHQDMVICRRPN